MSNTYLFVYGTLLGRTPDPKINYIIKYKSQTVCHGYINALLYDLGRYPGAVLSNNPTSKVFGRLLQLRNKADLTALDYYEDYYPNAYGRSEFIRREIKVHCYHQPALSINAWCYLFTQSTYLKPRIKSGYYRQKKYLKR